MLISFYFAVSTDQFFATWTGAPAWFGAPGADAVVGFEPSGLGAFDGV